MPRHSPEIKFTPLMYTGENNSRNDVIRRLETLSHTPKYLLVCETANNPKGLKPRRRGYKTEDSDKQGVANTFNNLFIQFKKIMEERNTNDVFSIETITGDQFFTASIKQLTIGLIQYDNLAIPIPSPRELHNISKMLNNISGVTIIGEGPLSFKILQECRKRGIPSIATYTTQLSNYDYKIKNMPILGKLSRKGVEKLHSNFLNTADKIFVTNESSVKDLLVLGVSPEKMRVWGRGTDTDLFTPDNRLHTNPYEKHSWFRPNEKGVKPKILVYVGRVSWEKGVEDLRDLANESISTLLKEQNIHLVILGKTQNKEMDKMIKEMKLNSQVHYFGVHKGIELADLVAHADLFIMPSITETFGQAHCEAQASHTPGIVPENTVLSARVIEGKTGEIYGGNTRIERIKNLEKAIIRALKIDRNQMGNYLEHLSSWREKALTILEEINDLSKKPRKQQKRFLRRLFSQDWTNQTKKVA